MHAWLTLAVLSLAQAAADLPPAANLPAVKELPDPFTFRDGRRVATRSDWDERRAELLELFQHYQYGRLPPAPVAVKAREESATTTNHPLAVERSLLLTIELPNAKLLPLRVKLTTPTGAGPFPVIIRPDSFRVFRPRGSTQPAPPEPNWPGELIRRGYALAEFDRREIALDRAGGGGPLFDAMPQLTDTGALMAWAWGFSRVIDGLVQLDTIDAKRIVVTGHSRSGKTALLAGALDSRVAITVPAGSGCGGAAPFRYRYGKSEALENIVGAFPYWFTPRLKEFEGQADRLPFDQHELKALVAPRALLTTEGMEDTWCNPQGALLTHVAARRVFEFLGVPGRIGTYYRPGGHAQNDLDWNALLDFADNQFFDKQVGTRFDEHPLPVDVTAIPWAAPKGNGAARAPNSINGAALALKSSGSAAGNDWKLDSNGYVGTYIRLDAPREVTFSLQASDAKSAPLNIVVADSKAGFGIGTGFGRYEARLPLPPGVWFVRVELASDPPTPAVTIRKLTVGGDGVTILNEHTDANALAAADSYIEHFRRAAVKVRLSGAAPGSKASVKLKRHAFMFGTAVGGFDRNELFIDNPSADSDAARYQQAVAGHFNAIVPGNAGKWAYNERDRDDVNMRYIDTLREFAKKHELKMRMHTLLWNTDQQPKWVIDLLDAAAKGDASAKTELRKQISERITYYVRDRANSYLELDVLNEPLHQPKYWEVFGPEGIANIYREAAQAVADAGAKTLLYANEYNVLQYSSRYPFGKGAEPDPYCNWYREHVEQLRAAGAPVGGIGVQYYAFTEPDIPSPHSAARIHGVFQNLSVTGLPVVLSEFGVKTKSDPNRVPDMLEDTMRITFGSANATGFIMWGFWSSELWDQARGGAFYDATWQPTGACKRWEQVMARWTTDQTVTVADDGTVSFFGYFGDYDITVNGKTARLTLVKGMSDYTLAVQ